MADASSDVDAAAPPESPAAPAPSALLPASVGFCSAESDAPEVDSLALEPADLGSGEDGPAEGGA